MGIVESSTQERLELREKRYQKYLELFFNTNLSTPEILQELDMSTNNRDWKLKKELSE